MSKTRALRTAAAALLLAVVTAACGSNEIDPNSPHPSDNLTLAVPPTLGGLRVEHSAKTSKKMVEQAQQRSTYARDISVFELRAGKELKAVFQVTRLTPDARLEDLEFRKALAAGILGTARAPANRAGTAVYEHVFNNQRVMVWFEDRFMEILLIRESSAFSTFTVDVDRLLAEALSLELRPVTSEGTVDV